MRKRKRREERGSHGHGQGWAEVLLGGRGEEEVVLGMESRRRGQAEEAVPTPTTALEKKQGTRGRREGGVSFGGGAHPHRLDVAVQEAHGVDGLDGLQDLLAQPQGGAQREGAPRLTAAQVSQVPALR